MSNNPSILANPGPLGLMGFGMTTVLLNIHNAGFFPMNAAILATGIFYGGIAQIIAGILEYKKGNTFGLTAFISYGFFWLTLVFIILAPDFTWMAAKTTPRSFLGCFLAVWGIFTLFMFVGTLKSNFVLKFIFLSLTILFFLLALAHFPIGEEAAKMLGIVAGYEGIICGASAIYLAMAEVINEKLGRTVLPIG
ncbi:MAG: acetate uptake transporter [Oligoflexia bacterium]|nr:acetate uptake transporter [Oligoflexia bacterium]